MALPYIGTKQFDETWLDFNTAWENVRGHQPARDPSTISICGALSKPLPSAAEQYESPSLRSLVGLCRELQAQRGPQSLFSGLPVPAGRLLGISHVLANKWLRQLERDKVLKGCQMRYPELRYTVPLHGRIGRNAAGRLKEHCSG